MVATDYSQRGEQTLLRRTASSMEPGMRFGRLVAIRNLGKGYWEYSCDCGIVVQKKRTYVLVGDTRSCGCLQREVIVSANLSHGMRRTPLYSVWCHAKARCHTPTDSAYPSYGGRGIVMCERWRNSFVAFAKDMGDRPSPSHQLERKNNDGPYAPDNCMWATRAQQSNNRRNNTFLQFNGERHTIADWARITGVSQFTISQRLRTLGWDVTKALSTPTQGAA